MAFNHDAWSIIGRPEDLRFLHIPFGSALLAVFAGIAYTQCMQYTIRGVPEALDNALRERARSSGKSLNEAALDALAQGAGIAGSRRKRRDLGDIKGTWRAEKVVENALAEQDRIDKALWR
jgi:hypothetical protein